MILKGLATDIGGAHLYLVDDWNFADYDCGKRSKRDVFMLHHIREHIIWLSLTRMKDSKVFSWNIAWQIIPTRSMCLLHIKSANAQTVILYRAYGLFNPHYSSDLFFFLRQFCLCHFVFSFKYLLYIYIYMHIHMVTPT